MREVVSLKLAWDLPLPTEMQIKWKKMLKEVENLNQVLPPGEKSLWGVLGACLPGGQEEHQAHVKEHGDD